MEYEPLVIKYECISSDAEINAIFIIPRLLKDLSNERRIEVLEYIKKRYTNGDEFGLN